MKARVIIRRKVFDSLLYPGLAVQREASEEGHEMRENPLSLVQSVVLLTPQSSSQDSQ